MRTTSEGGKDKPEDSPAPGLAKLSGKLADAKSKTDHEEKAPEDDDQTKEPMKHAIEDVEVQPLLNMLFDFIDTWERFANALNPSTPFSARDSRLLLSACLLLPALATSYLSRDAMMRGFQLGMGFAFFGRPLILRSGDFLNNHYPNWRTHCQLRHTILRDVPTNAQLTITILRAGERIKSPLAPSPVAHGAPKAEATITAESLLHLGTLRSGTQLHFI